MKTTKIICYIFIFMLLSSLNQVMFSQNFYNYYMYSYCSAYTENGEWELMWGYGQEQLYCILVQHKLRPSYSPIVKMTSGYYDINEVYITQATCLNEDDELINFEVFDYSEYSLYKALKKAKQQKLKSCLFNMQEYIN